MTKQKMAADQTTNVLPSDTFYPWAQPVEAVIHHYQTHPEQGLSPDEAQRRLERYGLNTIPEPEPEPLWRRYWAQLTGDAVVRLLLIGAVFSLLLGDYLEGIAIFVMLNVMAGFGLWQEGKASDAARSLRQLDNPLKLVIRGGVRTEITMDHIVPGDIIYLPNGSVSPVDGRVLFAVNAEKDNSKLTGESLSVAIDTNVLPEKTVINAQNNMFHRGDALLAGNATIVATKTGANTEIGKIAARLAETETTKTTLDEQLDELGDVMAKVFIWIAAIVIGFGVLRQFYTTTSGFQNISTINSTFVIETLTTAFINAVALIIAAIPEGLPAVLTITLAIAIKTMVKRNALIRKPKAVEGGGSMNVLLTDKTGTLTANQMEVTTLVINHQFFDQVSHLKQTNKASILRAARITRLCNNVSSATEVAMIRWVETLPFTDNNNDRLKEYEFNQTLKRMTTIYPALQDGHVLLLTKGAPEQVLPLCHHIYFDGQDIEMTTEQLHIVQDEVAHMASQGLRVIALADRVAPHGHVLTREEAERNLTFVGLLGIMDPPRDDVAEAMQTLKRAGISTVMVTGDNPLTAYHVAQMVGLVDQTLSFEQAVITGDALEQLENPTPAFLKRLHTIRVFARVTPQHKAQIVNAMRQAGFTVGMTGDGVNDAIALKESDIGFAMGNGTDVAREASDVVLMDSRFGTIPNAVEEGRNVIHRIRLYLSYILSGNGCEVGAFIVAYMLGLDIPLTALILLVINFATDSFPALAMAFEPGESDVMQKPPRERNTPFINHVMWAHIAVQTIVATIIIMGSYYYCLEVVETSLAEARAVAFMTYIFQKLYRAFTARSMTKNIWEIGLFRNLYSVGAVVISFSIALFCIVVPGVNTTMGLAVPAGSLWLLAATIGFVAPIAEELTKLYLKQSGQSKAILVEG